MKKLIALLLAAVLALSLVGCTAPPPEILGTYQTEVDLYQSVVDTFDTGLGTADTVYSLKNYLSEFKLTITFVFNADGTYNMTVEQDSIVTAVENLKTAVLPLLTDNIFAACKEQLTPYGLTIETYEDLEAAVGMSWDEIFSTALGKSAEETVDALIDESFTTALTGSFYSEGRFLAKEGCLYISNSLQAGPPADNYETYTLHGADVTVTGAVNLDETGVFSYPYVLTRTAPPPELPEQNTFEAILQTVLQAAMDKLDQLK
ncbi:MAG: hypothetical protein IJD81_09035 [Oscillospiraceae bacterium]|nr:hypothetical protein [Oscillospiraceae bacterium]